VKGVKNQSEQVKQWNKAAADLFSTAVSTIRQPIKSLFNWLIEITDIQRASKVLNRRTFYSCFWKNRCRFLISHLLTLGSHY